MKSQSNRIRKNNNQPKPVSQIQVAPQQSDPRPFSAIADEAMFALDTLHNRGSAAVALCLMNAESLRNAVNDSGAVAEPHPMAKLEEKFSVEGFDPGVCELSRIVQRRFFEALTAWRENQLAVIDGREQRHSVESYSELSCAIQSLSYVLNLQGEILLNHQIAGENTDALRCSFDVVEDLRRAFQKSHSLSHSLDQAAPELRRVA
jgi:hypothetical protein